jgi:hypothetical protein
MKIKIEIDMPRWLSRTMLVGIPITIVAIGAWVFAEVPNSLCGSQTESASEPQQFLLKTTSGLVFRALVAAFETDRYTPRVSGY